MQKKLLTSGNIFKRTDGRWNGVVWYMDEQGQRKRKSFCGSSKSEVKAKITGYIAAFNKQLAEADEAKTKLADSMGSWLRIFKFPSVERGTYDRLECTAQHQIYPLLGNKVVVHIPDQTRQLHGENPPVRRRKSASPPEVSASNRLCQPQGLAERKISRRTRG